MFRRLIYLLNLTRKRERFHRMSSAPSLVLGVGNLRIFQHEVKMKREKSANRSWVSSSVSFLKILLREKQVTSVMDTFIPIFHFSSWCIASASCLKLSHIQLSSALEENERCSNFNSQLRILFFRSFNFSAFTHLHKFIKKVIQCFIALTQFRQLQLKKSCWLTRWIVACCATCKSQTDQVEVSTLFLCWLIRWHN